MLNRVRARLTFANLASATALFVALSGGTALALSGSGSASNIATACNSGRVLTMNAGDPDKVICTAGSLTLSARCAVRPDGQVLTGSLLLSTSSDHAFVAGGPAKFQASDPPVVLSVANGLFRKHRVGVGGGETFAAAEAPAVGGRHLGGTAVLRAIYRPDADPQVARCAFAVDALTS